jgi:hypothetical protein
MSGNEGESVRRADEQVEGLVRAYLQKQAAAVPAVDMLARVKAQQAKAPTTGSPFPRRLSATTRRRGLLWGLAVAGAVLLAFLGGRQTGTAQASAETLVREARKAHALPLDRCYLVQVEAIPGGPLERFPRFALARMHRVWTRGDRFWIESANPERKWSWGRDDEGRVWLAVGSGRQGFRLDRDEAGDTLGLLCDVYSMRVETLLDEVLRDFDLSREEASSRDNLHVVRAERLPGRRSARLRSAVLEIDAQTSVLRRLVLTREWRGRPVASVTLTLVETGSQLDAAYTLEGHLEPAAPIYSRQFDRGRRARLLRSYFGIPLAKP